MLGIFVILLFLLSLANNIPHISVPLAINAPQTLYSQTTGDNIVLNCVITSGTATGIKWYKNSQEIVMSANPRFSGGNQNSPSLSISNVQTTDAGSYECEGTDGTQTVRTNTITVTVRGMFHFLICLNLRFLILVCCRRSK